ncbi:DNA-binding domain-containing protein [Chromobacterium sp. ASV23]|uniref:HvfC/BufC N-terminal domain-containing protein n=1 Tax=Chromobacterium sp. ASV23 TaxID=2795110 RepID=UPI0018EBC2B0|nr:DNA-binding domain-containing protein [Chromobacterium sp. ASV23]
MSQPALLDSQLWLLTAMTACKGLPHGLALAARSLGVDENIVSAPPRGDRLDRIGIYHHGYWQRLLECLRADYPMLLKLLGPSLFDLFARGYIASRPPRSPSLHDLGAGFAAFLAASQPDGDQSSCRLPVELASLERAYVEASRAMGVETMEQAPLDEWLSLLAAADPFAGLRVPASVRLLETTLPVHEYWQALRREDAEPPQPEARHCMLALARTQWRVQIHALDPWQYQLLRAMRDGGSVSDALCRSADADEAGRQRAQLLLWLPAAQQLGLLCHVAGA